MAPVPGGHDPLVVTPEQAVADVRSGQRVYVQGIAATPTLLTTALAEHGKQVHQSPFLKVSHARQTCAVHHLQYVLR